MRSARDLFTVARTHPSALLGVLQSRARTHLGLRVNDDQDRSCHQVERRRDVPDLRGLAADDFRAFDIGHFFPPVSPPAASAGGLTIASILDEFSDQGFRFEADLVRLTPTGWAAQLETAKPALVLVESAWRGHEGGWHKLIEHCDQVLDNPFIAMMRACRRQGIPTVFWNKEDPPNFKHFAAAAKLADQVFTSDADCLSRYRRLLGHGRVAPLPFAAQPRLHQPTEKRDHPSLEVAFAGTWYGHKHARRRTLLPMLLDAASTRSLHIFDRQAYVANPAYRFPRRFTPYLHAPLPYPRMLRAYRDVRLFLNVNSVIDSPTMFARRVLEILASQTAVVSTPSRALELILNGTVPIVKDGQEARETIARLLDDPWQRARTTHLGWRAVMRKHTYRARMQRITETLGMRPHDAAPAPVAVLAVHHPAGSLECLVSALHAQTYPCLDVILTPGAESLQGPLANAGIRTRVLACDVFPKGNLDQGYEEWLRAGAAHARGPLLTLLDSRDLYGAEFISDLVDMMSHTDCPVVTKGFHAMRVRNQQRIRLHHPQKPFCFLAAMNPRAMLARCDLLRSASPWQVGAQGSLQPAREPYEPWCLAVDPFNYVFDGRALDGRGLANAPDSIPFDAVMV